MAQGMIMPAGKTQERRGHNEKLLLRFKNEQYVYTIPVGVLKSSTKKVVLTKTDTDDDPQLKGASLLKHLRLRDGLTQKALAKKLNVSPSGLSAMEREKRQIDEAFAQRVAEVLDVDYRRLLD